MREPEEEEPESKEEEVVSTMHSGDNSNDVELARNVN